jgi:chromosome segregation ATPase
LKVRETDNAIGLAREVERLRKELRRRDEHIAELELGMSKARDESGRWRKKIIALSEHYRRLVRQLSEWSERLTRERSALEGERRRLVKEVERLRSRPAAVTPQSLSQSLGSMLERAPDGENVRRLQLSGQLAGNQGITFVSLAAGDQSA